VDELHAIFDSYRLYAPALVEQGDNTIRNGYYPAHVLVVPVENQVAGVASPGAVPFGTGVCPRPRAGAAG